jgi:hypothetical protein
MLKKIESKEAVGMMVMRINHTSESLALVLEEEQCVIFGMFRNRWEDDNQYYIREIDTVNWISSNMKEAHSLELVTDEEFKKYKQDEEKNLKKKTEGNERNLLAHLKRKYEDEK